ncbi:MAG: hypothetical protein IJS08_08750, partial [Victivallales bacterium]|nr:hypothetical protein [Victivallales bacterium]
MKSNSVKTSSQDDTTAWANDIGIDSIPECLRPDATFATSTPCDEMVSEDDPIAVESNRGGLAVINLFNVQVVGVFPTPQRPMMQNAAVDSFQSQTAMQGASSQYCHPQYAYSCCPPSVTYGTLTFAGEYTPKYQRQIVPQSGEKKSIEFCPSFNLEDVENATNVIKASVAEIILANDVRAGNALEYFTTPVSEHLWNAPYSQYPFLEQYCSIHVFPNLVAGAEKVLYGKGLHNTDVWDIKLDSLLKNDNWIQHFRQCQFPLRGYTGNCRVYDLPGVQGGCLEQFSMVASCNGNCNMTLPIRGIKPMSPIMRQTVSRFFALPLDNYPLFGLDRLHHGGMKLVF